MLNAQAFAASGPAALQHLPAPPGAHAAQKAVGARPAQIAGLKCAFHGRLSLRNPDFSKLFIKHLSPLLSRARHGIVQGSKFKVQS
jgi:hypothetical protein